LRGENLRKEDGIFRDISNRFGQIYVRAKNGRTAPVGLVSKIGKCVRMLRRERGGLRKTVFALLRGNAKGFRPKPFSSEEVFPEFPEFLPDKIERTETHDGV
jgi:hypothetical protein